MRTLNQQELIAVAGAGTTASASKAAKLAAIKAKIAALMKKHAAHKHPTCTKPAPTPETPVEESVA